MMTGDLGIIIDAFGYAYSSPFVKHLGLSATDRARLKNIEEQRYADLVVEAVELRKPHQGYREVETYYRDGLQANAKLATKYNEAVLGEIDRILNSVERSRRFRQLYNQRLIRDFDFDKVIRLNNFDVSLKDYKFLQERSTAAYIKSDYDFMFATMLNWVVAAKHLTQDEANRAGGDMFNSSASLASTNSGPLFRVQSQQFFHERTRPLLFPQVQAELSLSVKQAELARKLHEELTATMSTKLAEQELQLLYRNRNKGDQGREGFGAFKEKLANWRTRYEEEIAEILKPVQLKRYKQILFQHHLTHMHLHWALFYAGKPFDENIMMRIEMGDIQSESQYRWQADQLLAGYKMLSDVIGPTRTKRICGDLVLMHSTWAFMNPERDDPIRKRLQRDLLDPHNVSKSPANPRRKRP